MGLINRVVQNLVKNNRSSILHNVVGDNLLENINPFTYLSFYDDLIIFRPVDAILDGSDIVEITDTVGGIIKLVQPTVSYRPSLDPNNFITLSGDNTQNIGMVTDQNISYREVFITTKFDVGNDDILETTFTNFNTLLAGSKSFGEKLISGDGRAGSENDTLTSASVHDEGKVRLGQNLTEKNLDIIPLDYSVLSTVVGNYTTPILETDTVTVGYNPSYTDRAWAGKIGTIVFSKVVLLNSQRLELIQIMEDYDLGIGTVGNEIGGETG